MADFLYGQTMVNGSTHAGETLSLSMDYWTVTTTVNILLLNDVSGNGSAVSQAALDKLVQIISLNGQPVLLGVPTVAAGVYTLKFAIDHPGSWGVDGSRLVTAMGAAGVNYGFGTGATNTATLSTIFS